MGLFNAFSRDIPCPRCGNPGARRGLFGGLKCPNSGCEHFDPDLSHERSEARRMQKMQDALDTGSFRQYQDGWSGKKSYGEAPAGDYDPGEYRFDVAYENFRGERKTFTGDWRTLRRRGVHVSLKVMPTGTRIALATKRIGNWSDVADALARCPAPQETRVLNYHARRGTTSDINERLKRKYPHWLPHV